MNMKETILTTARNLIADPAHWTQDALARDAAGNRVYPHDFNAVSFCMLGALSRARIDLNLTDDETPGISYAACLDAGIHAIDPNERYVSNFNDHRSHDEILAAFDAAIAKAREEAC